MFHAQISMSRERNPAEKHMYLITVLSVTSLSTTTATKRAKQPAEKMQTTNANVIKYPPDIK